jgi:hypothetical protein
MLVRCESLEPPMSQMGQNENSPISGLCRLLPPAPDIGFANASAAVCQFQT